MKQVLALVEDKISEVKNQAVKWCVSCLICAWSWSLTAPSSIVNISLAIVNISLAIAPANDPAFPDDYL